MALGEARNPPRASHPSRPRVSRLEGVSLSSYKLLERWAPEWAVIVCASTDRGWRNAPSFQNGLLEVLTRLRDQPKRQRSIEALARLSGSETVARMVKLHHTSWPHPLWWLDADEDSR